MAEKKPIFALDLTNEGIALWHRKGSAGWVALGQVSLSDPEFERRLIELRDKAPVRGRAAVIRIPRSEVMLSKVRIGVFEGEAAASHARKQISEMTPYAMEQIAYDLGDKGPGTMAPVAIAARKTLVEADEFARSHGFDPVYFTTQYGDKEFDREPRFYLAEPNASRILLGWAVPWAAAAAIGLTAGFLGYSWLSAPSTAITTALERPTAPAVESTEPLAPAAVETTPVEPDETAEAAAEEPVDADILSNVAPKLPPIVGDLIQLAEGRYPQVQAAALDRLALLEDPTQARLVSLEADPPALAPGSEAQKTTELAIREARRDLPDVKMSDEIIAILQDQMVVLPLSNPPSADGIELVRLTSPNRATDAALLESLPLTGESKAQVSPRVTALPDPPPPPVSLVTAEPGTLIPTEEGTLGPGNILIFAGTPENAPPPRPGSEVAAPAPDPLAGKKPRPRPEGLVSEELLATLSPEVVEELSPGDALLAAADPALREPKPRYRPASLSVLALSGADATDAGETREADLLALADPALAGARPRLRPDSINAGVILPDTPPEGATTDLAGLSVAEEPAVEGGPSVTGDQSVEQASAPADTDTVAADSTPTLDTTPAEVVVAEVPEDAEPAESAASVDLLASADPALQGKTPRSRPANLRQDVEEPPTGILALADPALKVKLPRNRPSDLAVDATPAPTGLIALADPTLQGKPPRLRPSELAVPQDLTEQTPEAAPATVEDDPSLEETETAEAQAQDPSQQSAAPEPGADTVVSADTTETVPEDDPQTSEIATTATEDPQQPPADADSAVAETTQPETDAAPAEDGQTTAQAVADATPSDGSILLLADPNLADKRSRPRPAGLNITAEPVVDPAEIAAALAEAQAAEQKAVQELAGKRARARPANLRTDVPLPPVSLLSQADPSLSGKQAKVRPSNLISVADVIKPAIEADTAQDTLSSATRLAVAISPKPRVRPARIASVATRVIKQQQQSSDTSFNAGSGVTRGTAKTPRSARGTAKPAPGPTAQSVARAATEKARFRKSQMSLVGVFGAPSARRALVRLPTGRYVKVKAGDRVSGWRVSAIGETSLRIQKGGRNQTLRVP